jgi:hypothetical protein
MRQYLNRTQRIIIQIFLILNTLILFGCEKPDECELQNECTITFINYTDTEDLIAIQIDGYDEILKYDGLQWGDTIKMDVPVGYSKFMLGVDAYVSSTETVFLIKEVLDEFKTESCEKYTIEINSAPKDQTRIY